MCGPRHAERHAVRRVVGVAVAELARLGLRVLQIADRREFLNESVNLYNIRIEQFPDVVIARLFGFGPAKLLEFSAAETADVDVKQLFG